MDSVGVRVLRIGGAVAGAHVQGVPGRALQAADRRRHRGGANPLTLAEAIEEAENSTTELTELAETIIFFPAISARSVVKPLLSQLPRLPLPLGIAVQSKLQ